MDSQTEEIKGRLDIVDFIGQYVQLKKAGINYKGLCPFHGEKTPSFMVNKERQVYKCFGCGEGGDIFDFVQKMEALDFYDSLKYLAERAGVQLKARDPQAAKQNRESKTQLLDLNKAVAQLYHQLFLSHKVAAHARNYAEGRKLSKETIAKFKIGYAPNNIARVRDYLHKMGFTDNDLSRAGNPERFRDRLMFPIADIVGNIVGFSGRSLQKDQEPKYLNTRETPVFYKSKILYGFDLAKKSIRENDLAIVVEGQMDVALSHQAGVTNAVATSGTALTQEHLMLVRRQTMAVAFAFDADEAGFKAALKALETAWSLGMEPSVITLPEGIKDAGEAVEKDQSLWQKAASAPTPAFDWLWQKISQDQQLSSTTAKKKITQTILPMVAAVVDPVEKDDYIRRLARSLGVGEQAIRDGIVRVKKDAIDESINNEQDSKPSSGQEWIALLALMYILPDKIAEAQTALAGKLGESKVAKVYESVFEWYNKPQSERGKDFLGVLPESLKKRVALAASEIEKDEQDKDILTKDFDGRLLKITNAIKEKVKVSFAEKIAQAEREGSIEKMQNLLNDLQKNK